MSDKRAQQPVNQFLRVLPYVWPYRRKVVFSTGFAVLVALLWGLNLSAAFPIVKILLQGETVAEWVNKEIASAQKEVAQRSQTIERIEKRLEELKAAAPSTSDESRVDLLKDLSRQQSKLSSAARKSLVMNWVRSYLVPWLPKDRFDMLALTLGLVVLATLIKGLCIIAQEVLIGSVVELTAMDIRKQCFRRTLALDYQTLSWSGTADLMSRFTYDIDMLRRGLTLLGGKIVREPLKALCCIVGAFFVSWQLTLLSFVFLPLVGVVFYRIGRKLKQASHRMMESMSRIYKTLEETFEALKVVMAFNGAARHRQRFHRENKAYYHKAMKIVRIDALTSPTTELLGILAAFISLLPGAYLVLRQTDSIWDVKLTSGLMDVADLTLLYMFLVGTIDPIRKLSTTYAKLKRAAAAADRIFGLMDREPLVRETADPVSFPRHSQSIEFQDVHFSYATSREETAISRPAALRDVSLRVRAGEVIAVVGENGSGKSTLVNLLPRFYDPDHGAVLIDGVDLRRGRLRDLRGQIGIVTQETLLFDETILENIRYGRRDASRNEIERAARQAHVMPFLDELPEGFETRVGEKGQRLSGGQRQRIALARAVLRDPTILILDEATSAIDAQSEQLIHQTLRNFVVGRTTFLITHSVGPSILDFVSRIVVMDQGRLVAAGPHEDLIRTCPVYQQLFQAPSGEDDSPKREPAVPPGRPERPVNPGLAPSQGENRSQETDVLPIRVPHIREPGGSVSLGDADSRDAAG